MYPTPKIVQLSAKKCIGLKKTMSVVHDKTQELWKQFISLEHEISNKLDINKISLQVYPENYFQAFNPTSEFEKWALVEVTGFEALPKSMATFLLEEGAYAVFHYKQAEIAPSAFFQYIYGEWLPKSGHQLDERPHFEVLGEDYKHLDPNSEELIYIPIR